MEWVSALLILAQPDSPVGVGVDPSSIIVALISIVGTLGAAWFMFKGKTQDTANWLIHELRAEAKSARRIAQDCNNKRAEDRIMIDDLRSLLAGLQSGHRLLQRENKALRAQYEELRDQVECRNGQRPEN